MPVKQLPHGVVRLISSTQVINSVTSIIKELVENAIDARATVIDIKLEKYGLEKIEVRDNGSGINNSDVPFICKPNHTSKISSLEDLESLESYGFRGEALNSICAVSQLSITTKTEEDDIATKYTFDCNGTVREKEPSHHMRGTSITVTNLFKNVPVRRQFYESLRKATEELKKIEKIVKILSVIHPKLRMTISHNKCLIWHKTAVTTLKQSLSQMYPHVVLKNLEYFSHTVENISIELLICKRDCNWSVMCQPLSDAILFFINRRPVKDKKVEKVVLDEMLYLFQSALPSNKCPLTLISLRLSPQELDVNLEPDKTKVFIKNHEDVLKHIRESIMLHFYKQPVREVRSETEPSDSSTETNLPKRPKLDTKSQNFSCDNSESKDAPNLSSESTEGTDENVSVNEFEDCDMSALEDLLKRTENTIERSTAMNSKSDLLTFDEAGQQSSSITSECKTEDTESSALVLSDPSPKSLVDPFVSIGQESLKSTNTGSSERIEVKELEISPKKNQRLSFTGNLVDDLFQSQIADDEEICLEIAPETEMSPAKVLISNTERLLDEKRSEGTSTDSSMKVDPSVEPNFSNGNVQMSLSEFNSSNIMSEGEVLNDTQNKNSLITKTSNLSQTTLSQWSKGHVSVNNEILKGPVVLAASNNDECKRIRKRNMEYEELKSNQSSSPLERSVSSQMGRKDLAGLTNFAKTARLKLIENNPGMSFTRVASELAKQWRGLDESKKNEYAEKARVKKVQKVVPESEMIRSEPLIKKQKVHCSTSINDIKTQLSKFRSSRKNPVRIIKGLESENIYLCRITEAVMVVNAQNLRKNVTLHRYLCYSSLPSQCLDTPLKVTEELIGEDYWNFLLSLDKSDNDDGTFSITDPRIVKNGFKIIITDTFGVIEMCLTGIAEHLKGDGLEELIKTLRLALIFEDVRSCRTDSIKQLLQERASATCIDKNIDNDELEGLLEYWVQHMSREKVHPSNNEPINLKKLFTL